MTIDRPPPRIRSKNVAAEARHVTIDGLPPRTESDSVAMEASNVMLNGMPPRAESESNAVEARSVRLEGLPQRTEGESLGKQCILLFSCSAEHVFVALWWAARASCETYFTSQLSLGFHSRCSASTDSGTENPEQMVEASLADSRTQDKYNKTWTSLNRGGLSNGRILPVDTDHIGTARPIAETTRIRYQPPPLAPVGRFGSAAPSVPHWQLPPGMAAQGRQPFAPAPASATNSVIWSTQDAPKHRAAPSPYDWRRQE